MQNANKHLPSWRAGCSTKERRERGVTTFGSCCCPRQLSPLGKCTKYYFALTSLKLRRAQSGGPCPLLFYFLHSPLWLFSCLSLVSPLSLSFCVSSVSSPVSPQSLLCLCSLSPLCPLSLSSISSRVSSVSPLTLLSFSSVTLLHPLLFKTLCTLNFCHNWRMRYIPYNS